MSDTPKVAKCTWRSIIPMVEMPNSVKTIKTADQPYAELAKTSGISGSQGPNTTSAKRVQYDTTFAFSNS